MELAVNTRYAVQSRVVFGRVPEPVLLRALADEGELLPLHVADIAERFRLRTDRPLLLHSDQLGGIAVVPMACDAYTRNHRSSLHGPADRTADHLLYLDGARWARGEYEFVVMKTGVTRPGELEQPPTWAELTASVTNQVFLSNEAG